MPIPLSEYPRPDLVSQDSDPSCLPQLPLSENKSPEVKHLIRGDHLHPPVFLHREVRLQMISTVFQDAVCLLIPIHFCH